MSSALADWFNKILCNDPTVFQSRRLQGVVYRSDYQTRKPDEVELQREIDGFISKYPRSNGIWGIHAAGTSFAHIHWLHLCNNYHRQDCKCRITTFIRQQRYSIKWDRKFATEHLVSRLVSTIIYLFQLERKYLAIQFFGTGRTIPKICTIELKIIETQNGSRRVSFHSKENVLNGSPKHTMFQKIVNQYNQTKETMMTNMQGTNSKYVIKRSTTSTKRSRK